MARRGSVSKNRKFARLTDAQREFAQDNLGAGFFHSERTRRFAPRLRRLDRETTDQHVALAVVKATSTWNPESGSFSNWVGFYVRRELGEALKSVPVVTPPSWYTDNSFGSRCAEDVRLASNAFRPKSINLVAGLAKPKQEPLAEENASEFRQTVLKLLPARDASVIDRVYFGGKTINQVADEDGVSRQMIDLIHRRSLERLRSKGRDFF